MSNSINGTGEAREPAGLVNRFWLGVEPLSRKSLSLTIGGGLSQAKVVSEIMRQARSYTKEDLAIILAIACFESGFNQRAKNPYSSAYGVFQIIDRTWQGLGFDMRERGNLSSQVTAGLLLYQENLGHLAQRGLSAVKGAEKLVEMYTLHHDGPSGLDAGGKALAEQCVLPIFRQIYSKLNHFLLGP